MLQRQTAPNWTVTTVTTAAMIAAAALTLGFSPLAQASDQIGIYAVVKKVRYEPDANNSTAVRVRVCGAFAKARLNSGDYGPAEPGYMYYSCPTGQEALCRMQWGEIEAAGKAGTCIGWGMRRDSVNPSMPNNNGAVRTSTPVANPDVYTLGMGTGTRPDLSGGVAACKSAESATIGLATPACDDGSQPPVDPPKDPPMDPVMETPPDAMSNGCALSHRSGSGALMFGGLLGLALFALRLRRRGISRG